MDPIIKVKWLEALKSGKYAKGKGLLRSQLNESFCCLGVLCEVMGVKRCGTGYAGTYIGEAATIYLSSELAERARVPFSYQNDLAAINDRTETFDEVIKYIEETL